MTIAKNKKNGVADITPFLKRKIDEHFSKIHNEQVKPWAFFNSAPLRVKRCRDLGDISYSGIGFVGSPREVFWGGYIEPWLEDAIHKSISDVSETPIYEKNDMDVIMEETSHMIKSWVEKIYLEMAAIDQNLRGGGYPDSANRVDCSKKIAAMQKKVNEFVKANSYLRRAGSKNKMKALGFWVKVFSIIGVIAYIFFSLLQFSNDKIAPSVSNSYSSHYPSVNAGSGSQVNINYGNQIQSSESRQLSKQAVLTPVGAELSISVSSADVVGVTSIRQEGVKTLVELEPISKSNT